jgi:hypothetical protein
MPADSPVCNAPTALDRLRTELADLAYDLERQGRLDAADVVMQLDARLRELAGEESSDVAGVADPGAFFAGAVDVRPGSATPATEI